MLLLDKDLGSITDRNTTQKRGKRKKRKSLERTRLSEVWKGQNSAVMSLAGQPIHFFEEAS
jgi:hypothetical protein